MNEFDDLIGQLEERLSQRAESIDPPAGLADRARHRAQRRVARRVAMAGASTLAVVVVLVVVLSGGGSRSHPVVNASYVARQVSAQLKQQDAGAAVLYTADTSPPGTPTAGQRTVSWDYFQPGRHRDTTTARTSDTSGRTLQISRDVLTIVDRQATDVTVTVNPVKRTWSRSADCYTAQPGAGAFNSNNQLLQQIADGKFVREGTTTVAGQPALRLRLKLSPKIAKAEGQTLYVNASSYRPIERVITFRGSGASTERTFWRPANAANRARAARSLTIPAGYRQVTDVDPEARYLENRLRKELRAAKSPARRHRLQKALDDYTHCPA